MVVLLVYHKSTLKTQIWHILFISGDIWLQHHQTIPNSYFSGKLFTLLYHLIKKNTYLCLRSSTLLYCWFTTSKASKPKYDIFSSFLEIYDYNILKLRKCLLFSGTLFTLFYHLPKKNIVLCLGNTLHGCIAGLPQIRHQNPNMAFSLHFWILMIMASSNYTQYLFFLETYLPYCITWIRNMHICVLEILYMVVLLVYHKSTIKNPNMAYSLHFWILNTTASSNYTQNLFFWKPIYLIVSLN